VPSRTLGLVIATRADWPRVARLAQAARARGDDVSIFAMDEGVAALAADRATVDALTADDVQIIACGESAHRLKLGEDALGCGVGSQIDHAVLAHGADRVLAFT
jgi:hypothetical protein